MQTYYTNSVTSPLLISLAREIEENLISYYIKPKEDSIIAYVENLYGNIKIQIPSIENAASIFPESKIKKFLEVSNNKEGRFLYDVSKDIIVYSEKDGINTSYILFVPSKNVINENNCTVFSITSEGKIVWFKSLNHLLGAFIHSNSKFYRKDKLTDKYSESFISFIKCTFLLDESVDVSHLLHNVKPCCNEKEDFPDDLLTNFKNMVTKNCGNVHSSGKVNLSDIIKNKKIPENDRGVQVNIDVNIPGIRYCYISGKHLIISVSDKFDYNFGMLGIENIIILKDQ
jgi:hypothetical protein